jgi:hypothetical protein
LFEYTSTTYPAIVNKKALPTGKAFKICIFKKYKSAGNSSDANIGRSGSDVYSDVVLNVPLIRPKRSLITDLRASWPEAGNVSLGLQVEEDPS